VSPLGWYALVVAGPPLAYGTGLLAHHWWQQVCSRRQAARRVAPNSVASIAARVAQGQADRPPRWPRVDPDRGVMCDDRPTKQLPVLEATPTQRHRRVQSPPPH
jgi:hypothetical protein